MLKLILSTRQLFQSLISIIVATNFTSQGLSHLTNFGKLFIVTCYPS